MNDPFWITDTIANVLLIVAVIALIVTVIKGGYGRTGSAPRMKGGVAGQGRTGLPPNPHRYTQADVDQAQAEIREGKRDG